MLGILGADAGFVFKKPGNVLTSAIFERRPLQKRNAMRKVILITGASAGMGKTTARLLIQQGHKVYVAARRLALMEELELLGGHAIQMDISSEEDVSRVVGEIIRREKRIDVLWNNAGYGLYGTVEEVPIEDARHQFEVNLFGLARLTQLVIPHMRKANKGLIINTSSMGGKMYTPLGAWYHASKHALEGWSDCLRLELASFGINVVVLEPGIIATEWSDIMMQNCSRYSGKGPYGILAQKLIRSTKGMHEKGGSSDASIIAQTVSKIVHSKDPKTRYRVGQWARPMVWMRLYLGDNLFDKIIMSQLK
jgi:NAD(P)-dependent dehydrogenase (short-subunit alcohol dehydrogenase family)